MTGAEVVFDAHNNKLFFFCFLLCFLFFAVLEMTKKMEGEFR